jgi:polar amino acid transport system permease protein
MFAYCSDPSVLSGLTWLSCFLTTGTHFNFYWSFVTVLSLIALTAPLALVFGMGGAVAARSPLLPLRLLGKGYIAAVRGVPDIVYFLFFVIALDQGIEYVRHLFVCDDLSQPVWVGTEFRVCPAAKVPSSSAPAIWHSAYAFGIAVFTFALVFGAFAGNVFQGAMSAVPRAQLETAEAYGMSRKQVFRRILMPQMWLYALPGLSNLWLILIKATPLLFLLGIQDIVYWARELGGTKQPGNNPYPHGDWRVFYFLALLVFYLTFTRVSEVVLGRITQRLTRGQATMGGEAMRKAVTP